MNVREIVKQYLEENGYDGLAGDDCAGDDCGCSIDDLFICDSCPAECVPGNRVYYGTLTCFSINDCEWRGDCNVLPASLGHCIRPVKKAGK